MLAAESAMILSQSEKQDSAWEFLKWWTSYETQSAYGNKIETQMGESARWATANRQAFLEMPFPTDQLAVIEDSFTYAKQPPVVLGGYYTSRHITNAINRVAVSGVNVRDSLEEAVKDINRELKRRNQDEGGDRQ